MQIDDADILVVHHAQPVSVPVPRLCIVSEPLAVTDPSSTMTTFEHDARRLAAALWRSLPGATLDRLAGELLLVIASQLRVSHANDANYQQGWDAALRALAAAQTRTLRDALGDHHHAS